MKCQIMKSATKKCGEEAVMKWQPYIALAGVTANIPICKKHRKEIGDYLKQGEI